MVPLDAVTTCFSMFFDIFLYIIA